MDFQKDVIEYSHQEPVLVDFWAEWCGPCRMLSPTLEALAEEQAGRWKLVKINTEEHPELAQQYGIRSIPNCKLFHNGKVIDEFVGALTRPMLERWFDEHLPDPARMELDALLATAAEWPDAALKSKLEQFVLEHPGIRAAELALAQQLLAGNPTTARTLAATVPPGDRYYDLASDIIQLADLLELPDGDATTPAGTALLAARDALRQGKMETTLQRLIESVGADKAYHKGLARLSTVALFRLLGEKHPLTQGYRRKFSMALY